MKRIIYRNAILLAALMVVFSCRKLDVYNGANSTIGDVYTDLQGPLRSLTDVPIGFGIGYALMKDNTDYRTTVASEGSSVTFEYEMKHGAIVQDNGMLDFSRADELLALSKNAGLEVFGHTLVWHQNQNATYLNSIAGGGGGPTAANLIANPGFEEGLAGWNPVNTGNPAGSSTFEATNAANEFRTGTSALKVVTDADYTGSQWRVQIHTSTFSAQAGRTYEVSFWIKAANPGGSIRLSLSPDQNTSSGAYQGDQQVGTDWTQIVWSVTMANDQDSRISFDLGQVANTYFIDDVRVVDTAPIVTNFVENPGFENELAGWNPVNTGNPAGSSTFEATNVSNEVRSGDWALKVVTDADYTGSQWRVQIHTNPFLAEAEKTYDVSFWIKAANPGGSIRLSLAPDQNTSSGAYQGDQEVGTDWTQITWSFTMANNQESRISFDLGQAANTYFIDDVRVSDPSVGGGDDSDEAIQEAVDNAMKDFITQMVSHYRGDVKAWDVVNEPVNDNGTFRAGPFDPEQDGNDVFYWGQYLGRDYIKNAFTYAHEADPDALLFINDYNLEANPAKVDGLIALVEELKAEGVPIHGIGTQMHSGINTSYANIDAMFKKLAATGLQIRISEMDVRLNPGNSKQGVVNNRETILNLQAHMYYYVISSYLKHVPAAQRHGITMWNVTDVDSWIVVHQNNNDAPTLFDEDFNKKPAYGGVVKALKGQ